MDILELDWQFRVEGFGYVGYANLEGFVAFPGFKQPGDLAVDEMTEGKDRRGQVQRIHRVS